MLTHWPSRLRWCTRGLTALGVIIVILLGCLIPLRAANSTSNPAPPATAPAAKATKDQDFISFLIKNQDQFKPFLDRHNDDLTRKAVTGLLSALGGLVLIVFIFYLGLDAGMAFGFSVIAAKSRATVPNAIIFAVGRVVINIVSIVLYVLVSVGLGFINPALLIVGTIVVILLYIFAQVMFISIIYRTTLVPSLLFFLALIACSLSGNYFIAAPLARAQFSAAVATFMDKQVVPSMVSYTNSLKDDLKSAEAARDKVSQQAKQYQTRLEELSAQTAQLTTDIETKKNSESSIYGQVARQHAAGELETALASANDFLKRFPNGTYHDAAQAQLTMIQGEIAARAAAKAKADEEARQAEEQAQAALKAKIAAGQVSLSEMRAYLLNRSREQVLTLFGQPTQAGVDRYDYARNLVNNPLRDTQCGLSIYFHEGRVQSVDYFYF